MRDETRLRFYVDDTQIYHHYFGEFDLRSKYSSPFPHRRDPVPSFMFKNVGTWSSPKILWNDFGMTDIKYKDGIGFVMEYFQISRKQAVRRIWKDMVMDPNVRMVKPRIQQPLNLPYEFDKDDIQDFEMKYWGRLWFSKQHLKFFNVHSLTAMRRVGKKLWWSTSENPTFIYLFSKKGAFKAYRPLDPRKDKFRGQNNGDILEGYDQLPKTGQHLIITSSLKDTMTLRKLGYLAVNPTSENSKRGLYKRIRELNYRFNNNIYILFDNDKPGIRAARSLAQETGWKVIMLPTWSSKDPSDLVMSTGNYLALSMFFDNLGLKRYYIWNTYLEQPTE